MHTSSGSVISIWLESLAAGTFGFSLIQAWLSMAGPRNTSLASISVSLMFMLIRLSSSPDWVETSARRGQKGRKHKTRQGFFSYLRKRALLGACACGSVQRASKRASAREGRSRVVFRHRVPCLCVKKAFYLVLWLWILYIFNGPVLSCFSISLYSFGGFSDHLSVVSAIFPVADTNSISILDIKI